MPSSYPIGVLLEDGLVDEAGLVGAGVAATALVGGAAAAADAWLLAAFAVVALPGQLVGLKRVDRLARTLDDT
ncbi:hypothetical protein [Halomicrobium salinisoli]|uniref:hypothetical protein n=1 Tax=Halomicrobium salinisoli TaxID=2878391 RepID=UPI001CF047F0|nr:hypothetical protein [Halomicrobium salinisoli]